MDRLKRIADLWNWLPAFRAVAETEHLSRAAEMLNTSAPALSRTIRLLEDSLDAPLFHRTGGRLQLTDLGRALAAATRDGMRRVDEALDGTVHGLSGPLRVSSEELLTTQYLLTAAARLRGTHPGIVPHISCVDPSDVLPQLLRGDLDVALVFHAPPHRDIAVERLGVVSHGVYCSPTHPLYDAPPPTTADLLAHRFAAPPQQPGQEPADRWPAEHARRIALTCSFLDGRIEACASGELLGVFADSVVASFTRGATLRRLAVELVPPAPLYAMKRVPVATGPERAEALLEELRRELQDQVA